MLDLNTATIREENSSEIDSVISQNCKERHAGLLTITALSYEQPKKHHEHYDQPNKLSQPQETQFNLLRVTFQAIFKKVNGEKPVLINRL